MRRIVLNDIDLTIRQQALSLAIMVVGIRVNKAVPRDKGRAPLVFVVGQYPSDLMRSGVSPGQFLTMLCSPLYSKREITLRLRLQLRSALVAAAIAKVFFDAVAGRRSELEQAKHDGRGPSASSAARTVALARLIDDVGTFDLRMPKQEFAGTQTNHAGLGSP
jgi:hypothetical protein